MPRGRSVCLAELNICFDSNFSEATERKITKYGSHPTGEGEWEQGHRILSGSWIKRNPQLLQLCTSHKVLHLPRKDLLLLLQCCLRQPSQAHSLTGAREIRGHTPSSLCLSCCAIITNSMEPCVCAVACVHCIL